MEQIETKRLILRPFRETDLDDLYEFLAQQRDAEFEAYPGLTYENCRKHLEQRLGSEDFLALELKQTGKVIGNLYCADREHQAKEVGYIVNRDYRRQGYALEALRACTDRAFRSGTHRVYAECDPRNEASWGLLEKAGFRREALFRQHISFRRDAEGNPIWSDTYVYAMLESEAPGKELALYIPRLEDLWFYQKMLADPATMAYNAPWFPPDGCIPFPESEWPAWHKKWIGQEPERFYAFLRRKADGTFVGGIDLRHCPEQGWWDMGVVIYAPERGKGYGRQGLELLLDRAFRVARIAKLHNEFETARDAAYRIHRAVGFREVGIVDGIIQLELTREEYTAGKAALDCKSAEAEKP